MAQAKENVAYDLSLFEPRENRAEEQTEKAAVKEQQTVRRAAVRPLAVLKWSTVSLLVLLSLTAVMFGNVQINKLNNQTSTMRKQLSSAQSEQIRLSVSLESRTSLNNVENYAVSKLGLQKIGQYQIQYIHLADKDKVEVSPEGRSIFVRLYNLILEYL